MESDLAGLHSTSIQKETLYKLW